MSARLTATAFAGGRGWFTVGTLSLGALVAPIVVPVLVVVPVVVFGSVAFGASVTLGVVAGVLSVFSPEIL